jgi:hypothetical protein
MRRMLIGSCLLALLVAFVSAADKETKDTPKAAAARKKLQSKVTVEFADTLLREVLSELKDKGGIPLHADTKGGVTLNAKITFKAEDKPLEEVLNAICDKNDMGYFLISQQNDTYDGNIKVTRGKERGYQAGEGPGKATAKDDKDKPKDKEKTVVKEKPKAEEKKVDEKPKAEERPAEDETSRLERQAGNKLKTARSLVEDGKKDRAIDLCEEIIKRFPDTKAAEEAKQLLEKLSQ